MNAAVALLSGGLDSGTAMAMWLAQRHEVTLALTLDYGQRSAGPEQRAGKALADRFGVPWRALELPWLGACARAAGSALVSGGPPLPELGEGAEDSPETAAAVWVPARNLALIAVAAVHAEAAGCEAVLVGFNAEEAETFEDNSESFVAAMDATLAHATRKGLALAAPTLSMAKTEIAATAGRLGLGPGDFWSCYGAGPEACGRCESCRRSANAFRAAERP